ncbi:hypothetical protein AYI69_g9225 [Smittium culicis]|uniref:Uncharacterized protein n=1 Tax=Smittium culicis TaxID=133412 RepID=A0A1R1XE40_9FUNG|nr:hypothetical protein AYI69_g9225 [Smittium culicis]
MMTSAGIPALAADVAPIALAIGLPCSFSLGATIMNLSSRSFWIVLSSSILLISLGLSKPHVDIIQHTLDVSVLISNSSVGPSFLKYSSIGDMSISTPL